MKITQKISALFLSVLILLFSFGFSINKMVCLKSGIAEVSLNNIEDCCDGEKETKVPVAKSDCCDPKPSTSLINEAHCCDLSSTQFHLNDYNPSEQHSIPSAVNCLLPVSINTGTTINAESKKLVFCSSDLPPPLYGKQLLSFISVLII